MNMKPGVLSCQFYVLLMKQQWSEKVLCLCAFAVPGQNIKNKILFLWFEFSCFFLWFEMSVCYSYVCLDHVKFEPYVSGRSVKI